MPQQNYQAKLLFAGKKEPLELIMAEAAWGRLKKALQEKREGYIIVATKLGKTLALNLDQILLGEFKELGLKKEYELEASSPKLTICYKDKEKQSFEIQDPRELANLFITLKPSLGEESFTLITHSNTLIFKTKDLLFLETNTIFVEEGFLFLHQEKVKQAE